MALLNEAFAVGAPQPALPVVRPASKAGRPPQPVPERGAQPALAAVATVLAAGAAVKRRSSERRASAVPRRAQAATGVKAPASSVTASPSHGQRRALVVGGGVAGLATAGQLAKEGLKVTLYEKNSQVGGRCQSMQSTKVDGYRWDTGPSLMLLPKKYEDAYKRLGTDMKKELNLKRVDPPYRVSFGDETYVDVDYDPMKMTEQMEKFEPGCTSNYYRFLSVARRMLDMGLERFVDRQFESWPELVDPIGLLPEMIEKGWFSIPLINMLFSVDDLMKSWFKDDRLRAIFTFQTLYGVKNTLASLAEGHGVEIKTGAEVDEVLVEGGKAVGIRLKSGEEEKADVVVVNADTPWAYKNLLHNVQAPADPQEPSVEATAADLDGREYSCGVIAMFWAVDCKVDYLRHHTIFLGTPENEEKAWTPITSPESIADKPNFYVHCPTRSVALCKPRVGIPHYSRQAVFCLHFLCFLGRIP
ncbi:carA2 [Symbiodinium sp. CCMP2456]|nr:carA2 [Symbiodinium sp. CCMP2456]